jgi:hypothetical protein
MRSGYASRSKPRGSLVHKFRLMPVMGTAASCLAQSIWPHSHDDMAPCFRPKTVARLHRAEVRRLSRRGFLV